MAGKKSRKRQTGSTKKASVQNENDGSVSVEGKKPKLDDGREEQSDKRVQQPSLETLTIADANNDLSEDLQSEESKYVPPFTRKSKKSLQRDRLSSVSPDVKSARPKRPWKGKRISKETQQTFADHQSPATADQQTNDMVCVKDSPKMGEEEKEEDKYEALKEVMICTQENKDVVVFSSGQNTANELEVITDEVLSSSMVSTAQEETSNIVMLVIENLFEVMYKQIYQCNNSEITSAAFEEPKASVEERDTHSVVNIDIQDTDGGKEIDAISEEALKPSIDSAAKPGIMTKAALKKVAAGKTASKSMKKCKAMASSESQTTLQKQQNQVKTNKQQHTSAEGHVHSTQENATSEGTFKKYDTGINHTDETLENDRKGDLSSSPHQNENKSTVNCSKEIQKFYEYESDSQNYTVTSNGEICANDRNAESKNLVMEGSPMNNLEVKDVVSLNNAITSVKEEVHALSTTLIPMDKDLSSTDICCGNHVSKDLHQQRTSNYLLKSNEHTGMVLKPNINTPMLENELPTTVASGDCEENENNMCQIVIDQDLADQMVPNNCETTTVMLKENPGVNSLTRNPKRREIDSEDSAGDCSQQQCSPNVAKREDECHSLDEQMNRILFGETLTTKKMKESCQESPQLAKLSTVQASDVCVDQDSITHEQIKMDTTVTYEESLLQSESICKPKMQTVELDQTVEDEITDNQTSQVEAECSLFGFDGDIMEFDSSMDCTDSQLVNVQDSSYENVLPGSYKRDTRQLPNNSNVAGNSTSSNTYHCSVEVPSDKGMIKGLISELSGLNKFIMGAWKDLENQKKRRQARLKLGKMKKLK